MSLCRTAPQPGGVCVGARRSAQNGCSPAGPHSASYGAPKPVWSNMCREMCVPRGSAGRQGAWHVQAHAAPQAGPQGLASPRVMLKISGEALQGPAGYGVDPAILSGIARDVAAAVAAGVQVAVVVGGGNFFRGVGRWPGLDRASADYVGMLATVMNAVCLQSALEAEGVPTRVQTAIEMREIAEPYIRRRAMRHLERGRVVIFGAGTGNPFFTTDTAAALRAAEIGAGAFLKATKVDGVYDRDPAHHAGATLHRSLTFQEVLHASLAVMDGTAITLCKENDIPVVVFNLTTPGTMLQALLGDWSVGTVISSSRQEQAQPAPTA
ncbi:hypothetical protein ACKKBG_A10600 [Auxenochlorella protothecoides x Auxenochlorella symbiontica]